MAEDVVITLAPDLEERVAELVAKGEGAMEVANAVAEVAKSIAPVESGEYKDGITVQRTKTGARVFASDYKSTWIEFGVPSHNQPAHFVLRRAAESLGLKFKKTKGKG